MGTRQIGNSHRAKDSRKVGKFGMGTMTAQSITGIIQFISGSNFLILDPHATRLPNKAPSLRGNLVDPESHRYVNIHQEAPSQMEPFLAATAACPALPVFKLGTSYPGTLFRLPLRTPEAAVVSEISQEAIDAQDFQASTLQDFCSIASDLLLFTRSVRSICVYVKGSADSEAVLLHESSSSRESFPVEGNSQFAVDQLTIDTQHGGNAAASCKVWAVATNTASDEGTDEVAALLYQGPANNKPERFEMLPAVLGRVHATMPLPCVWAPSSLEGCLQDAIRQAQAMVRQGRQWPGQHFVTGSLTDIPH